MDTQYVDIMIQCLEKKEKVLEQIIRANKRQAIGLEDPKFTPDQFDETVDEKDRLIKQLEQLDNGFEKLFDRMKEELNNNKELYSDKIKRMQELIKSITDKSVEIQTQEARNKNLMMQKFASIKTKARNVRKGTAAVNKYYQSMAKLNFVDPQFMDNKK